MTSRRPRLHLLVMAMTIVGLLCVGIAEALDLTLQTSGAPVKTGLAALAGINLLVVALVLARDFGRHRTWGRLLVTHALATLAIVTMLFGLLLPQLYDLAALPGEVSSLRVVTRVVMILLLAIGLGLWDRPTSLRVRPVRFGGTITATVAALYAVATLAEGRLDPTAAVVGLLTVVLLGLAAGLRRAGDDPAGMVAALTVALSVAAVGTIFYVAESRVEPHFIHAGDLFWGLHSVLLLGVAYAGVRVEGQERAVRRNVELRLGLAAKLHDGLSQELALVASQTRWLLGRLPADDESLQLVASASERALSEARHAMRLLKEVDPEDFSAVAELVMNAADERRGVLVEIQRFDAGLLGGVEGSTDVLRRLHSLLGELAAHTEISEVSVRVIDEGGAWLQMSGRPLGEVVSEVCAEGAGQEVQRAWLPSPS